MADIRVCGPLMDEVCANFEFDNDKMTDSWDEIITDAQISVPGSESGGTSEEEIVIMTQGNAGPSVITLDSTDRSAVNDFYNGYTVTVVKGVALGESRLVTDYDGGSGQLTLDSPLSAATQNFDFVTLELSGVFSGYGGFNVGLLTLTSLATYTVSDVDDYYNGWTLTMTSGAATGDVRTITDFIGTVGAHNTIHVDSPFSVNPAVGDTFSLVNGPASPSTWVPDPSPVAPSSTVNDDGYVSMKVPDTGDRIVRQSKRYFGTTSYKYNTALFTAVLNVNSTVVTAGEVNGVISRIGVFDDKDDKIESTDSGFFFEYETIQATTFNDADGNPTDLVHPLKVGIRYNSTSNTLGDVLVTQQSFNVNDLNRHAHIQINDWSQIYTFEIKYNAIGHVEWSIYLDGERILLHKEQDITGIIHTLPQFILPLRFEITNNKTLSDGDTDINTKTDGTTTSDEMYQFHASMLCEGGSTPPCVPGVNVVATSIRTLKPVNTLLYTIDSFSYLPVFSVKLNASYVRMPITLYEILYLVHKRGPFMYAIIRTNGSHTSYASNLQNDGNNLTDPGDWVVGTTNRLDYNITANSITDISDCIYEQYVDADCHGGVQSQCTKIMCSPPAIASNIGGTPDIFTLVIKKMSHLKATANFNLRWVEDS